MLYQPHFSVSAIIGVSMFFSLKMLLLFIMVFSSFSVELQTTVIFQFDPSCLLETLFVWDLRLDQRHWGWSEGTKLPLLLYCFLYSFFPSIWFCRSLFLVSRMGQDFRYLASILLFPKDSSTFARWDVISLYIVESLKAFRLSACWTLIYWLVTLIGTTLFGEKATSHVSASNRSGSF